MRKNVFQDGSVKFGKGDATELHWSPIFLPFLSYVTGWE